jgi:hypothetical protein
MKNIRLYFWGLLLTVTAGFTACTEPNGEAMNETVNQAKFDKSEYYPFDVVTVQLPEAATTNQYDGTLGDKAIVAQRIADSILVVALPDLAAGEYTLLLQTGNPKTGGKIKIVALPAVSNPEAVIAEIKTTFAQLVSEAVQANSPNASLLQSLTAAFDNQLSQLSESEKAQLAAYWQAHPELGDFPTEAALRLATDDATRMEALRTAIAHYHSQVNSLAVSVFAFSAGVIAIPTTSLLGGAVAVIAAIRIIQTTGVLIDATANIVHTAFILDPEKGLQIKAQILSTLKSATAYDYTLSNGNSLVFDIDAVYRSVAAQDVSGAAPSEAKEIITYTNRFQTLWDKIADGVNTLHSYCDFVGTLTGRPKKVSEITNPNTAQDAVDDWSLAITSGSVSAQKTDANTYKFTTNAEEDVEFKFKITASGMESEIYEALLKVKKEQEGLSPELIGKWKLLKHIYRNLYPNGEIINEDAIIYPYEEDGVMIDRYLTFLSTPLMYQGNALFDIVKDGKLFQSNGTWFTDDGKFLYYSGIVAYAYTFLSENLLVLEKREEVSWGFHVNIFRYARVED